jgi:polyhydroxyalkanoate synthesis repressor PhaR
MTAPPPGTAPRLEIKKYPNRRYYDATHSRHLTLEEIRALIRDGHDVLVTDSKTGADITAQVLTQIILELETGKIDAFPVALLARMIRSNDQLVREFVERYFNQAFAAYQDYQKHWEQGWRQLQGGAGVLPAVPPWMQGLVPPLTTPPPGAAPAAGTGAPASPGAAGAGDAAEWRQAVARLQQELAGLKKRVSRPRRRRRR